MVEKSEELVKENMVETCRHLHQRNMLAAADGNVSYRFNDEKILITPSGQPKGFIDVEEIAMVTLKGDILKGKPSGEKEMHLEVYKRCPKARAVVHAHPPTCIAWSLIQTPDISELPCKALPEVILATGGIPLVPYARPTTADMARVLRPYLPQFRVMILTRHGGLSWGEDLEEAYMGMERMEHSAQILYLAQTLGKVHPLPPNEVEELKKMRRQMGPRTL